MGYVIVGILVVALLCIAASENDHVNEWFGNQAKALWSWPKRLRKARNYTPLHSAITLVPAWPAEGE